MVLRILPGKRWILSFPTAVVNNFGGLLALRFFQGFFGSPALANGGATIGDMYSLIYIPYGLYWWTSASNILLRRARRLHKLTGDSRLQSEGEIEQRNMSASDILFSARVKPIEIMLKDPCIFVVDLYPGYFYGVFPVVFPPFYGFSLGQTGLTFLAWLIGVTIAAAAYLAYLYWYMEHRLIPAIIGSFLLPIGLFIHWPVPLVGVGIFSLFIYVPFSYPKYAASLFPGNSVWRFSIAGGSLVFARPLFTNLGVHKGVTLLAGLSVAGIFGTTASYIFGKQLRARSKFAQS
ncbi:hypothetical protein B0J12DRAFT_771740 [Macrophomina phaseolina]|uniref:Major facilitator superfamily domain general substrate transporter n=1 Tax=Macrophomina phaseolina TaxID=35725 RepID=A0ABQ8FTR1_9PEZI|nr:hypothetical protein B0J12DRAFT_771740 [Macrophomina phaseolina]